LDLRKKKTSLVSIKTCVIHASLAAVATAIGAALRDTPVM